MSLREFLRTVRLYWKTFAVVALAVLGLGAAWLLLLSPLQYVSTAQLLVSVNGTSTANAYQNDDVISARVNSYVALLTSDVVSQRVVDKLGLGISPRQLAAKVSAVQVPPNTAVIDIAATDRSPEQARKIADTVASEFVGYTKALESPTGADAQKVQTSIVSAASQPRSRLPEQIAVGGLFGLLAVLGGATAVWIRSATDRVVRTPVHARDAADLPVFAVPDASEAASLAALEPYRRLHALLRKQSDAVVQVSPVDVEAGAENIAASLGRATMLSGGRCVLVDATGRQPELVGGRSEWPDVRDASAWAEDPESAATVAAQSAIEKLKRDFGRVVIATPPAELSATASAVCDRTDAVVLVAVLGKTTKSRVRAAVASLRGLGANPAAVLTVGRIR